MPFTIVRDDITHVRADAIVNAANEQLRRGGGVCGAIFAAAGAQRLQRACDKIGHCATGSAVATPAYRLHARYVIHAVGPIWQGGSHGERELLASCYRTALELAHEKRCRSIAFPLISAGIYGYPPREALQVAQDEIRSFLDGHEMDVILVLYNGSVMQLADDLRLRVKRYIDDTYVGAHADEYARLNWEQVPRVTEPIAEEPSRPSDVMTPEDTTAFEAFAAGPAAYPEGTTHTFCPQCGSRVDEGALFCANCGAPLGDVERPYPAIDIPNPVHYDMAAASPSAPAEPAHSPSYAPTPAPRAASRPGVSLPNPLRNLLNHLDAGFSETMLSMIDERGLRDAQVYKRANISRQHFSKMRSNPHYKPTKTTVLALAVALELTLDETTLLLERAGFALSHADQRDIIVEFFIREGIYDVFQINDALFAFDQPLLG